jgi:hypothetical protein
MTTPGADRLDGVPEGGAAPWPWRPTALYRHVKGSLDRAVKRTAGPLPAGTEWDSTSTLDEITCLAELLTVVYDAPDGNSYTLADMVIENFKAAKGFK